MEPLHKTQKKESKFKKWFNSFFCLAEDNQTLTQLNTRAERTSKIMQKTRISMSLLGSYKNSILCKISRKNFIVNSNQINHERLPSAVSKYLGEKISSSTAVVKGEISRKVTRRIPFVLKIVSPQQKILGDCIQADILNLKLRTNDLFIYRPKLPSDRPYFFQQDQKITIQIISIAQRFRNSAIILPKDTVLDQIGLCLSSINKFVEVETIVTNALTLCIVVYIGSKQFVLFSEQQQIQFVVKQLKKDLLKDEDYNISQLVKKIYDRSSISDVLFLLRKSINQAYVDTIFSCFLRNALYRQYLTNEQISQYFPHKTSDLQMQHTPSIRLTARFNNLSFKPSCSDGLLNGSGGELNFENEIQTFEETQISMRGLQIMTDYNL